MTYLFNTRLTLSCALSLAALSACDDDKTSIEAGTEAGTASGTEAGTIAGTIAGAEAGTIAGAEAGTIAGAEAGTVAGTEAGTVAGTEAGTIAGTIAGAEAGTIAGAEAGTIAGAEAGTIAGAEAGTVAGAEAGTEGGAVITPEGACSNEGDLDVFTNLGESGVNGAIEGCVFSCLNTADTASCQTCVQGATNFSDECTGCFVEVIGCTVNNCVAQCINASSPECATCRDTNCMPAFEACSGVSL